ncbi:PTS glucose transporter subunit IIA [Exiguobacterium alkaliphilum]|uniref:PTS glucose transporter subunit IIA n=1 Tax=Exiguobacterium alkaliphilum TaxID=1428684 RepID=UPI001FE39B76|nr:PTS glucose transporter subunit IIA [Exiguobacterium alkaliphilum]
MLTQAIHLPPTLGFAPRRLEEGEFSPDLVKAHVTQGEFVEKGQLLIEFDLDAIIRSGRALTTPVIVTNRKQIAEKHGSRVATGETLFVINE